MASILNNLGMIASQNHFLAYFIIYLVTIFLGNIAAFASFWVVLKGFLGPWGVPFLILTIFLADISGDLTWYALGKTLRNTKLGNFLKNRMPRHEKIEARIQKNGVRLVFLAKFLYASSFPVIFLIGWSGIDFKKFFRASILSVLLWIPVLIIVAFGLFSGLTPLGAVAIFKKFEVLVIVGIVGFIAIDYFLGKLFKRFFDRDDAD